MRRLVGIALVAVTASFLVGCAAGRVALDRPGRPPILDRPQTDEDVLPNAIPDDGFVAGSIRYVDPTSAERVGDAILVGHP